MCNSQIKLFLSIDITGSTKMKNSHSYSNVLKRCNNEAELINKFKGSAEEKVTAKDVYEKMKNSVEYTDWSVIITDLFNDFNVLFCKNLDFEEIFPWKFSGDELLYCFDVNTKEQVYKYVLAFYQSLRNFDRQYKENHFLRLKGAAWTAGFPVRNRIINTPIPKLYKLNFKNKTGRIYPYPHTDYIGPEMDIGFRIGKHTYSGMIVISLELAYILTNPLLEKVPGEEFKIYNVGWEVLKGVWFDRKYPIFWLQLPDKYNQIKEYYYKIYNFWDREENELLKTFDKQEIEKTKNISHKKITEIITELTDSLGVIKPYFCEENEEIPEAHKKLIDFINYAEQSNEIKNPIGNIQDKKYKQPPINEISAKIEKNKQENMNSKCL